MAPRDSKQEYPLWKAFLPVFGILAIIVIGLFLLRSFHSDELNLPPFSDQAFRLGEKVPEFSFVELQGDRHVALPLEKISSKLVLINFWASWCEACVVELPSLQNLANSTEKEKLSVILVNLDEFPKRDGLPMLKRLKVDLPLFIDYEQRLSSLFEVHAIPLTVVLDENRKVVLMESGDRDWNSNEVKAQIEKWLSKPSMGDSEKNSDSQQEATHS